MLSQEACDVDETEAMPASTCNPHRVDAFAQPFTCNLWEACAPFGSALSLLLEETRGGPDAH